MLDCIHLQETNLPRDMMVIWGAYVVVVEGLNMTFANLTGASDGIAEFLFKNGDKQHNFTNCVFENIRSLTPTFSFLFFFLSYCYFFFFFDDDDLFVVCLLLAGLANVNNHGGMCYMQTTGSWSHFTVFYFFIFFFVLFCFV
jgi:hypothetical protein